MRNPTAYAAAIEGSVRQNTSTPKYLYHYTDNASAGRIKASGRINPSVGPGDCALGTGTYLTAKQPRSSSASLLANNYGSASGSRDKVESFIRVDADRVGASSGRAALGRDVWVVPGGVDLKSAGASVGSRSSKR